MLHNKRSHRDEKPAHRSEEWPPLAAARKKLAHSNEDPTQPKINKLINFFKKVSQFKENIKQIVMQLVLKYTTNCEFGT